MSKRFDEETVRWLSGLASLSAEEAKLLPESDRILYRLISDRPITRSELASLDGVHRHCVDRIIWEREGGTVAPLPPAAQRWTAHPEGGRETRIVESDEHDRRRNNRLLVNLPCVVHLRKPDATAGPALEAVSLDLSDTGLRLSLGRRPSELYDRWRRSIDSGDSLQVAVRFDTGELDVGLLRGSVVWMTSEPIEPPGQGGIVTIGVLLELLTPSRRAIYEEFLHRLADDPGHTPDTTVS